GAGFHLPAGPPRSPDALYAGLAPLPRPRTRHRRAGRRHATRLHERARWVLCKIRPARRRPTHPDARLGPAPAARQPRRPNEAPRKPDHAVRAAHRICALYLPAQTLTLPASGPTLSPVPRGAPSGG